MTITIFTPTYNRVKMLRKLYDSLIEQSNKDFIWVVVDDGSSDETKQFFQQVQKENRVAVTYIHQENQGKYMALKRGIEACETPWFICIDSDDVFTADAVETMLRDIEKSTDEGVGFIYPQRLNGEDKKWVPQEVKHMDIMDAKVLYGIKETAILCKTKCLKKVQIPQFDNEKFLSEEIIYIQLAESGKFIPRNKWFYLSEYQPEGLTKNLFTIWRRNPQGTVLLLRERFNYSRRYSKWICLRERTKSILNLNALCMASGKSILENTPSKVYSVALYIPSLLWKRIRFGK